MQTLGWTQGGRLWLTRDGRYAEVHPIPSVAAAPDGSEDRLGLTLSIAADWRAARPGSSTAFLCEPAPDALLAIFDRQGALADCTSLGEGDAWRELEELPDC